LEIDGTPIPRSQLEAAARFNRHLSNDAGLQQVIRNYLTGEGAVAPEGRSVPSGAPPAPVAPVMPEGLDLEDPSIRALYSVIQQQNERFDQLSRGLQVTSTQQAHSQQQQYQAQYNEAAESFAKDHDLSPDEVQQLGNIGARMNNIGAFMQEFDPITGVPRKPNMIQAYKQALEQVYYMVPEYRDREFRKSVETMQERSKKQKLLGAVGGSSGSVSRTQTPAPPGSRESKNDMIREVASMMSGEWSEPSAAN
jgi:hypothetical protein